MINLESVNTWNGATAREAFLRCCGSRRWAEQMAARRPFASEPELIETARRLWRALPRADWLEAFAAHPRIGDLALGRGLETSPSTGKYVASADLASREQAGIAGASQAVFAALADLNRQYEARFGYIFIVCARGKSAAEMLALLQERLRNDPDDEIRLAAAEQEKITLLRLEQLAP